MAETPVSESSSESKPMERDYLHETLRSWIHSGRPLIESQLDESNVGYQARGFLDAGMAPRPSFNDGSNPDPLEVIMSNDRRSALRSLRTPVSTYDRQIRYVVFEFEQLLDSSSIDAKGWIDIAQVIHRNYQLFDAFVVLHGTDSLAYTCSALSFMLQNLGKPVILTGSQAPIFELQNDATDNLLGSLVVAGHFMIPEVCLFFHHKLFRGNRTTKSSSSEFEAFSSPNHPPLATISSMKTHVNWSLIYRPTHLNRFNVQTNLETSHVACLRIFPGILPEMVDGVLRLDGLRGLILETFGAGNAPGGADSQMMKVIADGVKRGIVIVNITQCMSGTVSPLYASATALGSVGVVLGHDMTSEAALTKLSYLLARQDLSIEDVRWQMSISIRGELSEQSKVVFKHPKDNLSPKLASLTRLAYAISTGDLEAVQEVTRAESDWLLHEADYSGNTPMHLAATGPNVEILRDFLTQGGSVHLRNRAGRTPLFLAASAGMTDQVALLRQSGAHLHSSELGRAWLQSSKNVKVWDAAGLSGIRDKKGDQAEGEKTLDDSGLSKGVKILVSGPEGGKSN
ncbi:MAG: hypothetical protein M1825_001683 [Sarcosagium campestre]|nr:MAG: hypothetical protein M1825_001683 [Sarcosagium campestre]